MTRSRTAPIALLPMLLAAWAGWSLTPAGAYAAGKGWFSNGGGVVLQPCNAQGVEIKEPGYFQLHARPGAVVRVFALVGNLQKRSVSVSFAPVDATSGLFGGISYNLPRQARKHVGAWIHLASSRVRLPYNRGVVLGISIRVPPHTAPGEYVGGLSAYIPAPARQVSGHGSIVVQLRRVLAVVVTVPGRLYPRFSLGRTEVRRRPDAVYIVTHIHNTGTILLSGRGHLWLWRTGLKRPVLSSRMTVDITVPRTTVHFPVLLGKHPNPGRYGYRVTLTWTGGHTSRSGTFTIP